MLENELQYHGLAERSKSANDVSMSCENFVKFGLVTSELTVLICKRQVRHSQKLAFFVEYLLLYWTDFRNLFPYESALCTDDGFVPYFPIYQGTLPWQPNNFAIIQEN